MLLRIFRWLAVTFSMYSKIPMPRFTWKEDDMGHSLLHFPLVGALIGALIVILNAIVPFSYLPVAVRILLTLAIPLFVTGGFHADGFMDTEDALHSYAAKEKKLEILKDPHIGAFAVIALVKWMLVYAAAITAILLREPSRSTLLILGLTFVCSRALSGLTSLLLPKAKPDGMLVSETRNKQTGTLVSLWILLVVAAGLLLYLHLICGLAVILSLTAFTFYYRYKMKKEFGGVTGDTAGFFLTLAEIIAAVALAAALYLKDFLFI